MRGAMMKRVFDVIAALILLVLLSPILLIVAILVRIRLGTPVVFRQQRPGLGGAPFVILKFRTMSEACGAHGELLPDSARLTRFGRFLRSTSLDELPELWNVLKGDMSFVGPRPLLMEYLPLYNGEQARRMEVRPGITGLAQVNGRNAIGWDEKFALDLEYVERHNFRLDLKILLLTVLRLVQRGDIDEPGGVGQTRFKGNR